MYICIGKTKHKGGLKMEAPVDVIIKLIKEHLKDAKEQALYSVGSGRDFLSGKMEAYTELIKELEGFKKLFN